MPNKDTLLVLLSDMHSGSNFALFPDRTVKLKGGGNHTPNSDQQLIYARWLKFIDEVSKERKGRKVILVNDGDAIEGHHHKNTDAVRDIDDQCEIHIELMNQFQKGIGWQRGDALYYVRGTETHTTAKEEDLAEEMGAIQHANGEYIADHLELNINGRVAWFIHEGSTAGNGANEGNALRNWLRNVYFDALKDHEEPPDAVYSGHVHTPAYQVYIASDNGQPRMVHGIILPSWQKKTRFAYKVAPVAKNRIGGTMQLYTAGGDIRIPYWSVDKMDSMLRG